MEQMYKTFERHMIIRRADASEQIAGKKGHTNEGGANKCIADIIGHAPRLGKRAEKRNGSTKNLNLQDHYTCDDAEGAEDTEERQMAQPREDEEDVGRAAGGK